MLSIVNFIVKKLIPIYCIFIYLYIKFPYDS